MRRTRTLPAVGPVAVGEIEAGFSSGIVESIVDAERAGGRVKLEHVEAGLFLPAACDSQAMGLRVVRGPVRIEGVADLESGHFDRLCTVRDVEHNQAVRDGDRLNQKMPNDAKNPTGRSGKHVGKLRRWLIRVYTSNALNAAACRCYENRAIGSDARLLRINLAVPVLAGVKVCSLEELEVGETPDLIAQSAIKVREIHRGVGGDYAVEFGQDDEVVRREHGVGKCGISAAAGANQFALVIDFDQAAGHT